jgi:hypothetical protein
MKTFLLLMLLAITVTISSAQSNEDDLAKREILQANREWMEAIIKRDSASLDKIVSQEFTLNGGLPRTMWMNNTLHHLTTSSLKHSAEPQISVYGNSAIATSTLYWKAAHDSGQKIDGEFLVTDVWKKNDGKWQVLIRMSKPK